MECVRLKKRESQLRAQVKNLKWINALKVDLCRQQRQAVRMRLTFRYLHNDDYHQQKQKPDERELASLLCVYRVT